ncbi:hypothetical protein C8Q76DRAFT_791483 [Earliella scabrosa]|nr:hypothetical protein C8Q76DRAFT_791483 [Earliella scabrosa]
MTPPARDSRSPTTYDNSRMKVNRFGPHPAKGAVGTFDGLVAAPGFGSFSVFTSPNQDYVPEFAIAHSEITTFSDGRWGLHEYTQWPQAYDPEQKHVMCIPRQNGPLAPTTSILWRRWEDQDWTDKSCGIPRFGSLTPSLMHQLDRAGEAVIDDVLNLPALDRQDRDTLHFLRVCLRHCLDRLRLLPAPRGVIIALAAHCQRLSLELAGLRIYIQHVRSRIDWQLDYRTDVLGVLGAHTHDPSVAQMLHMAGVPVWFQQHFSPNVAVWQVVLPKGLPFHFSQTPALPRLVLAVRDLSGALNTPGEWQRAMTAMVHRQLCASKLPSLMSEDEPDETPEKKRARLETQWPSDWSSTLGPARPVLVVRDSVEPKSLAHDLPLAGPPRPKGKARERRPAGARREPPPGRKVFCMNPFRQYYRSHTVLTSSAWSRALCDMSPLPQPSKAVTYYFPPPWLIDHLDGYETSQEKQNRYLHHMVAILNFCVLRLFDRTVAGRPLTISEWRDALWGDYSLDNPDDPRAEAGSSRQPDRVKVRHRLQQSLRQLFGQTAALRSYDPEAAPMLGSRSVTVNDIAEDESVRRDLVWRSHEINWRMELLALDAVMIGSNTWPDVERWAREAHLSEIWGPSRSGLNICPEPADAPFRWFDSTDEQWQDCRAYLRAFVDLLLRWPTCPDALRSFAVPIDICSREEYETVQDIALGYYVRTFVQKYQRLPTPPVRDPARQSPEATGPVPVPPSEVGE